MCSGGCHCCQSCSLADPVIIPSQGARQRIIHHPGRRDWRAIRFGLVPPSLLRYAVGKKNAVSKKENTHTHTHPTLQSVPPPIQRAQKPSMACLQTHPTSSNTLQTKHTLVVRRRKKHTHWDSVYQEPFASLCSLFLRAGSLREDESRERCRRATGKLNSTITAIQELHFVMQCCVTISRRGCGQILEDRTWKYVTNKKWSLFGEFYQSQQFMIRSENVYLWICTMQNVQKYLFIDIWSS